MVVDGVQHKTDTTVKIHYFHFRELQLLLSVSMIATERDYQARQIDNSSKNTQNNIAEYFRHS